MHHHIRITLTALTLTLLTAAFSHVEAQTGNSQCPTVEIHAERLPDMNMPRAGHAMFVCGDEVVVVGGHTTGFTLTKTAEGRPPRTTPSYSAARTPAGTFSAMSNPQEYRLYVVLSY